MKFLGKLTILWYNCNKLIESLKMKYIGFLLVLVGFSSIEHGGSVTWGLVAMIIIGALMVFPNLLQYFFEGGMSERK